MLTFENDLTFAKGEEPAVGLHNFWEPEDGFIWSKGRWCEVVFPFAAGVAKTTDRWAEVMIDLGVFTGGEALPSQDVLFYFNGARIGSSTISRRITFIGSFEESSLRTDDNVLTFDTPDAASPKTFGLDDGRVLGIQLFSLQVRRVF